MVHEVSFRFSVIPCENFFQETTLTSWPCPALSLNYRLLFCLRSPQPPDPLLLPEEDPFSLSKIHQTLCPPLHHSVLRPPDALGLKFAFCGFNASLLPRRFFLHPVRTVFTQHLLFLPFPLNFLLPRFLHLDFLNSLLLLAAVLIPCVFKLSRPFQPQASHHLVAEGVRVVHSLKIGQVLNQSRF